MLFHMLFSSLGAVAGKGGKLLPAMAASKSVKTPSGGGKTAPLAAAVKRPAPPSLRAPNKTSKQPVAKMKGHPPPPSRGRQSAKVVRPKK